MIKFLDYNNSKFYGIDYTYKIIPRSLKPYKLMVIYSIDKNKNTTVIAALICIKYTDENSLIKLFSLLRAYYNFSPTAVTLDFDKALINAFKKCDTFKKVPFLITCLFHFAKQILEN